MNSETHPKEAWVNAVQGLALTDIPTALKEVQRMFVEAGRAQKEHEPYRKAVEVLTHNSTEVYEMWGEYDKDIDECLSLLRCLDEKVRRLISSKINVSKERSVMPKGDPTEQMDKYQQIFDAAKAFVKKENK